MKGMAPLLALCLVSAHVALAQAPIPLDANGSYLDLTAGYRTGELQWNVAEDITGTLTPNVLSELTWEDLDIHQATLAARLRPGGDWYIHGSATLGSVEDGENQDSDYDGNNRTLEYSRSDNVVEGDEVWDVSAAVGYTFYALNGVSGRRAQITPLIGYSRHKQNLRITDAVQTVSVPSPEHPVPPIGPFPGLDTTYHAKWDGPWVGVELVAEGWRKTELLARLEYHRVDYYGEGNWNLRGDLAHPKSFEHTADGKGLYGQLGVRYALRRQGYLLASVNAQAWETDPGTDRIFAANGTQGKTRLNEVTWESWSVNLGVSFPF